MIPECPCFVSHIQHYKTEQEAESVGDHVGEVEAVPDIVELPDDEGHHEKQQQQEGENFVPPFDIPATAGLLLGSAVVQDLLKKESET